MPAQVAAAKHEDNLESIAEPREDTMDSIRKPPIARGFWCLVRTGQALDSSAGVANAG